MTRKMRQNEEVIKRAIVDGHRRGICDKDGNSILDAHNLLVAKPSVLGSVAKVYVYRKGRVVEK